MGRPGDGFETGLPDGKFAALTCIPKRAFDFSHLRPRLLLLQPPITLPVAWHVGLRPQLPVHVASQPFAGTACPASYFLALSSLGFNRGWGFMWGRLYGCCFLVPPALLSASDSDSSFFVLC